MSLFQNSIGFLPPYFGSGLGQRNFGFIKSAVAATNTYIVASGGCVSRDGDYLVHTFKSSDTLNITQLGSKSSLNNLQYLIVAGGGGGGGSNFDGWDGGGGGAGGFLNSSVAAVIGTYPVAIGAGGLRGNKDVSSYGSNSTKGSSGSNSSFYGITSIGGGGGGKARFTGGLAIDTQGSNGGSGGGNGANYNGILYAGGLGTAGQGFDGGQGSINGSGTSGGGGGAAGVGASAVSTPNSGGGPGISSSISGTSKSYSNGGNVRATTTSNRLPNTGDGGASSFGDGVTESENGGSGIVIVRYFSPQTEYIVAYGGTLTRDGDYLVRTFTGTDLLGIAFAPNNAVLQYLVVAGGGGGGQYYSAGGGGAGGLLSCGLLPSVDNYPVVIGAGGSGAVVDLTAGISGSNSTFYGLTTTGGGGGGGYISPIGKNGGSGGGGGGQDGAPITYAGGTGISPQGNNGGLGQGRAGSSGSGGGGGGFGSVGADAVFLTSNGSGGTGFTSSISGTSTGYAGGGGGGGFVTTGGTATQGGGAGGLGNGTSGQNATANTGSGGGGAGGRNGAGSTNTGGSGASGIVIVRYLSPATSTPYIVAEGGSISRDGDYLIHTFTGTDNFTVQSLSSTPAYNLLKVNVVAGGGGGGSYSGGAGGAGGFIQNLSYSLSSGAISYLCTIGSGGSKSTSDFGGNTNGSNSTFDTLTAIGGGKGGALGSLASNGGSGGGQCGQYSTPVATGTAGQGNNGGIGTGSATAGGGGGGASTIGANGVAPGVGGAGGAGILSSITGNYYAGGGGGAGQSGSAAQGGIGGGGNGEFYFTTPVSPAATSGTANTGGGGGAMYLYNTANGGNGGSGIIVISYYSPQTQYIQATGGTVTRDGDYVVHTFTSSANLNITNAPNNAIMQYLIIGGGGGSGFGSFCGGGGAGAFLAGTIIPWVGSFSALVGSGGADGVNGGDSYIIGKTAIGGGCGGYYGTPTTTTGANGGSGGGAGGVEGSQPLSFGGLGTIGQGNNGGNGFVSPWVPGGGGGGAGSVGGAASGSAGGTGGLGLSSSITGTSIIYAAGGGGNRYNGNAGLGGSGIGGNGGSNTTAPTNGVINTGSGGGGRGNITIGNGIGGSGIIIVRYLSPATPSQYLTATGGSVTRNGDYLVHTFNSTDNFTVLSVSSTSAYNLLKVNVIAGGGGGGTGAGAVGSGGGGAGGFIENLSYSLSSGARTYACVVGSGGIGSTTSSAGANGQNSTFDSLSAIGGGGGGTYPNNGNNGGSGGGTYGYIGGLFGTGTASQGNNGGGLYNGGNSPYQGGGGGGAAQAGQAGDATNGGAGGNGSLSSINGIYYGGGAGAGARTGSGTGGLGGIGGGGNGGYYISATEIKPTAGSLNTGGGGGGSAYYSGITPAANGGSGIIIISYYSPQTQYINATGGTITRDGDYVVHTFNSSGTLNVTNTATNAVMQYLVVAGGGGGGCYSGYGGGGGAGGLLTGGTIPAIGSFPITVGAGGAAQTTNFTIGNNGSDSSALGITSTGGGGGAGNDSQLGANGGSGGGSCRNTSTGGLGTIGQGFNGGFNLGAGQYAAAGGGGASAAGGNGFGYDGGGNGGNGLSSSISGSSVFYAGGGGGGGGSVTLGGTGGGGNGGPSTATSGTANTGGGGGATTSSGAAGGSGVVIVRYLNPLTVGPYTLAFSTVVTARGGTLTSNEISYLSAFEASVGSDLAEFDRLYIHGLGNNIAARTSFVNPSSTIATAVNNPTFTPYLGYQGNGINQYLDTNFNPSTQGVKYTLNNASIGVYSLTNLSATQLEIGCVFGSGANQSILDIRDTDNRFYSGINEPTTNISSANLDSRGLFTGNRLSSSSVNQYKNGVVTQTGSNVSGVVPNVNVFLLSINVNNTASLFSTRQVSLSFLGSSNYNQSNFYNSVRALGTGLGWFSYTNNFKSVVTSRGGVITANEEAYLRTFEASMGADLAEFDRLYIHGLSDSIAARTSFVNPSSTIITPVNAPTFTPSVGYQGNGTTSYLNTNFNPSTQGVKYTTNSASMGVYVNTLSSIDGAIFGQIDGLNSNALYRFSPDSYAYLNYGGGTGSRNTDNGLGLISVYKNNLVQQYYVKSGITNRPDTCTGSPLINDSLGVFCRIYAGAGNSFSNPRISLSFASSGLVNQSNFYNSVQALGKSIGWAVTPLNTNLYAAYNFESNATDLSGNGNNGTLVNSPTFSSGKFLQGVDFNSTNYISTSASTFNPSGDFSLSIWVKPSSFVNFMGILDKFTFGGTPAGWGLDIPNPNVGFKNPRFTINTTSGTYAVSGITSLSTVDWTNIICIFSANTIFLYKNGVLENSVATSGTLISEAQQLFIAGDNASTLLYNGSLDAFNFWTRALKPSEIATLQNYQYPFY